ncbi:replication initiation and membrane attachment family protein [Salirhabdus salicampi]|uniref:replication initiation and membrane attachment family protein n=1 Tax=Salirhabdus salicampi TaxID=476102 RepID=UPI0020C1CBA2|nr:DnaD domain protein [Salirhabdus salicampi]MCP8617080.1 DnaD domain protein [Salirhabdus salicampi]
MNERIKHLLPNDGYTVQLKKPLKEDYLQALTHLYQPLVGMKAISLYMTLLNDVRLQIAKQDPITHHTLMSMLNMDLDQLYEARLHLEAIGLLNSFMSDGNIRQYYYVLIPPFSTVEFFEDPMLSILLEHHIGNQQVRRLKQVFMPEKSMPEHALNKTKSFEEIFTTVHVQHHSSNSHAVDSQSNVSKDSYDVDFDWLENTLRKNGIPMEKVLTVDNKRFIASLVKIYHVDLLHLEKAILWSVNENLELLKDELHDACKDYYANHFAKPIPQLIHKDPKQKQEIENTTTPRTKEEKLIQHFESITHREILEDYSKTGHASDQEVKMLTNIMFQHGLSQGVMNVLVHYVLQKTNMKLTKNYVEKIASHWGRKNVNTVKEAMDLAKSENKLYQSWGNQREMRKSKEVLPDWFKKQKENEQTERKEQLKPPNQDLEKEKQELAEAFRSLASRSYNQ